MLGFRSHFVTWKIFCTNVVLRSALKQFGFGGIDLVRCLLLRYEEPGQSDAILFELVIALRRGFRKDQWRDALPFVGSGSRR